MSWTAPAFLEEFAARLEARDGLAGVNVYRAPVDALTAQENIVFVRVAGDQEWSAIGNQSKNDTYTVESAILITRIGAGDTVAAGARDRAAELLAEVVDDIQELVSGADMQSFQTAIGAVQINRLNIARIDLEQGATQNNERWAQVSFDIQVTARIS